MSEYFEQKTKTDEFNQTLNNTLETLQGKKVIIYGAGQTYFDLQAKYNLNNRLNVVGIADKRFEEQNPGNLDSFPSLKPEDIPSTEFDAILLTLEYTRPVLKYLKNTLDIDSEKLFCVFQDAIFDERESFQYLLNFNFKENLEKLKKKVGDKKIVLYGACPFFQVIKKYYNLEGLNIIAIADKKFEDKPEETFEGYKAIAPSEVTNCNPDYLIVTTKFYVSIIDELLCTFLKKSKIQIKPLVKKPFWTLFKEVWF